MSYKLPVFDPSASQLKVIKNILITTITTGSDGTTTITIPTGLDNVRVYIPSSVGGDPIKAVTSYSSTSGSLTIGLYKVVGVSAVVSVAPATASITAIGSTTTVAVVTGVSASTTSITAISSTSAVTVVTGVSATTASVTSVSTTTVAVVTGVSATTASINNVTTRSQSAITGIGTDVGYWSSDISGNLSHTHAVQGATFTVISTVTAVTVVTGVSPSSASITAIGSTTTVAVVTGVTATTTSINNVVTTTRTVVTGVSATTANVTSVSTTAVTVVTGVTAPTDTLVKLIPLTNTSLEVIITW